MAVRAMTQTTRLGRYEVVQRLAAGGMADVLLGRTVGIEGFERHVVIKRIRAEQARDIRYVTMFLDEARLAASLHHANIVQVNDIGQEDGEYFFAMEYVLGEDVRKILSRAAETDERVPLEHILSIITGAAAGLHHAHEQIRANGSTLGIVHRDVSPANILVGLDGGVKVVDFGIAKAAHQTSQTQSGVLKGKVAYMSPEQCNNENVDRRSDVFSLGIVLYELLTLRPLFQRENDFLAMTAIVHEDVPPPSTINPQVSAELDAIVQKALARNPADRYQTTDEMRRALDHLAQTAGVRTSTTALADYMKGMFGQRREPWLVADEDDETEELLISRDDEPSIQIERAPETANLRPALPLPAPRRRRRGLIVAALAVLAIGGSVLAIAGSRSSEPAPVAAAAPRVEVIAPPAQKAAPPPVVIPEVATPAPVDEPAPAAKPTKKKTGRRAAPAAKTDRGAKHWDPKSLFPE
ncbi:MAG: serine/threonine-protein kinase [Polyangiales bacterium]